MNRRIGVLLAVVVATVCFGSPAAAQTGDAPPGPPPTGVALPQSYVIGPEDVLSIFFWREKDLSGDVVVRPDGRISIPLVNEVTAAGLTPEELRQKLTDEARRYVQDPSVTVVVKQINSRKVYITGEVSKPGTYPLSDHMTVLQLIALAGGLQTFADKENIVVMRSEKRPDGMPWSFKVNYNELVKRVKLLQNIELKPGDTVIVP